MKQHGYKKAENPDLHTWHGRATQHGQAVPNFWPARLGGALVRRFWRPLVRFVRVLPRAPGSLGSFLGLF